MKPTLSIVIIVKNDRGIADTLAALEMQKKPASTEIIVVDSSPASFLADIRDKNPNVRWYQFVPKVQNKTSIPEQRNFGIRHAEGGIIVFIDANCIPSKNWLVELTGPILEGREVMTSGSVSAANPRTQTNFNPIDPQTTYVSSSPTINLAFKKDIWKEVNEFDESFLYGSDIDFTWRCVDAGHKILFVRKAAITHDWGDTHEQIGRITRYGKARARLFIKHPKRYKELFSDSIVILFYSLYIIGLPITALWHWYPLIIVIPLLKNINDKPFRTVFFHLLYALSFLKELIVWYL